MDEKEIMEQQTLDTNYLDEIQELKKKMESMVAGEEYEKVLKEHKKLTNDYINKRELPKPEILKHREPGDIIKEMNKQTTNHDYIGKTLEYRRSVLAKTGLDVFTDIGINGPGQSTADSLEVARVLEALHKEAKTPAEFNYLMDQTLVDDQQLLAALRAKRK